MDGLNLPTGVGCNFFLLSSHNVFGGGGLLVGGFDWGSGSSIDLSRSTAVRVFPGEALLARLAAATAVAGFDDACVVVDAHLQVLGPQGGVVQLVQELRHTCECRQSLSEFSIGCFIQLPVKFVFLMN